jgi:hypothetical protein
MIPDDDSGTDYSMFDATIMGPPIVWLASSRSAGLHDQRIVASEFAEAAQTG